MISGHNKVWELLQAKDHYLSLRNPSVFKFGISLVLGMLLISVTLDGIVS